MIVNSHQNRQNMVNIWKQFRTDFAFLADLVPILPESLLWRAVSLATDLNPRQYEGLIDRHLYALFLEALAARLPHGGRQALLKCCSNFGAIPIIDNKTIGCEPKEAEKPEIAGPGS